MVFYGVRINSIVGFFQGRSIAVALFAGTLALAWQQPLRPIAAAAHGTHGANRRGGPIYPFKGPTGTIIEN